MRKSTLFNAKKSDFLKFIVCPREQERGGLSQYGYFADKGVNFSRLCANVFYGRPLIPFRVIWVSKPKF